MPVSFSDAEAQAMTVLESAWTAGVSISLFGSLAVWLTAAPLKGWLERVRPAPRDIDTVTATRKRPVLRRVLADLGYELDQELLVMTEGALYKFRAPGRLPVEIRFDELHFNHTIPIRDRVQPRTVCLPLPELILSKLLIVACTPSDVCDAVALFASAGQQQAGTWTDTKARITAFLSRRWGAWYTASRSLEIIRRHLRDLRGVRAIREVRSAEMAVSDLATLLATSRKAVRWQLRSLLGPHLRWYAETSEPLRHEFDIINELAEE